MATATIITISTDRAKIAVAIAKASARGFQRTTTLIRKYGIDGATQGMADVMAAFPGERTRIYGRECGGIGPV